jgi:SAM-dependent methyltransferase
MDEQMKTSAVLTESPAKLAVESPGNFARRMVCPVCEQDRWLPDTLAQSMLTLPDSFLVVRCRSCGLRRLEPYLSEMELKRLYGPAYFGDEAAGTGMDGVRSADGNYLSDCVPARLQKFRYTVKHLRELRPRGRALLDFGAATGDFVAIARELGLDADGVELSSYAIEVAQQRHGIHLHLGGCEAIPARQYDFIHLHHVFEHLVRPAEELRLLVDHLAPGGILYIEIPYQFHVLERLRYRLKQGTRQATPTLSSFHHPFFYTPRSLRRLLERAGLDIESVRTFVPGHYEAQGVSRRIKKAGWSFLDRVCHLGNIIEAVATLPQR